MQHGVIARDGHIVRQARAGQWHGDQRFEHAAFIDHPVVHIGRLFAVAKKDEFAGALIDFGMRRDM